MEPMDLQQLKQKSPADLLVFAEELEIEGASNFRTQDLMFAILKALAEDGVPIYGIGVLEVLQDGFELPAGSGRHLCHPQSGAPLCVAHRRHGGR